MANVKQKTRKLNIRNKILLTVAPIILVVCIILGALAFIIAE